MKLQKLNLSNLASFVDLVKTYQISVEQQKQLEHYTSRLLEENEKYNLTAIVTLQEVVQDHFYDSLALLKLHDLKKVHTIADVGSGAGFPGIPLAIMCPEVTFNLVEVNLKKVNFLKMIAQELGLKNIVVHTYDWRTFLRKFENSIDLFIARASLSVDELLRIFKPSSKFQNAVFVYWASKKWIPNPLEKEYLTSCSSYMVGQKERQLCFFSVKNEKNEN
jgi:16S rRNA (guanine527-N7)-methyltransferase